MNYLPKPMTFLNGRSIEWLPSASTNWPANTGMLLSGTQTEQRTLAPLYMRPIFCRVGLTGVLYAAFSVSEDKDI